MTQSVVIVGAGPAGLACAGALAHEGIPAVIVDDNLRAGGQYFRQLPPQYTVRQHSKLLRETTRVPGLFSALSHPLVTYLPATTVWSAPSPLTIAYAGPGSAGRIAARAVVIATGAQDAALPFPGWTLPGVISAGGCLNLAKGHGLVPGGRVVVAGNGPLVLVAAATLARGGANVTHVIEGQPTARLLLPLGAGVFYAPRLVAKGIAYRARLLAAGTRFLSGRMIVRAEGQASIEAACVARVGRDGRPERPTQRLQVETLVTGYGLQPASDFARLMGCKMVHLRESGGWVPERSEKFETSVPGVYAVGDCAGIGGVEIALAEGRMVAGHIAHARLDAAHHATYRKLHVFRKLLSAAYRTEAPLLAATDATIVCRCEELTLGELKSRLGPGDRNLDRVKAATRLGMGRCQGRNCLASAAGLLGLGGEDASLPLPRFRPPARPVRIQDLVRDRDVAPAREPDETVASANSELAQ